MKISTIRKKMAEAEDKCGTYHMRMFWAETEREANRLDRLSSFWYERFEYWAALWENHPDR